MPLRDCLQRSTKNDTKKAIKLSWSLFLESIFAMQDTKTPVPESIRCAHKREMFKI